jgi:hypothetical protein
MKKARANPFIVGPSGVEGREDVLSRMVPILCGFLYLSNSLGCCKIESG